MRKEQFNEIIEDLKIEKNKWLTLGEVESILLSDGRGIYPNWRHMRFKFTDDSILIKHGDSFPYGARLGNIFNINNDMKQISFPPSSIIAPSEFYSDFRLPKSGDIVRFTNGASTLLSECLVENVLMTSNVFVIKLVNRANIGKDFRISFYDPQEYDKDICMHSSEVEGIYMKFSENDGKQRKSGIFHETIKCKEISEIMLKLAYKNKTYTIRGQK